MNYSTIAVIAVLISAVAFGALAVSDESDAVSVSSFGALQDALESEGTDTITVTSDIQVTSEISVAGDKTLTSSNGSEIIRSSSYGRGHMIAIGEGASLTLAGNLVINGNDDWISNNKSDAMIENRGTLTIQDDVFLTDNRYAVEASITGMTPSGGSAISNYGDLVLNGGSFTSNSGGNGVIYTDDGTVSMRSTTISDNGSRAVYIAGQSTFNMYSGTISDNNSGVYVGGTVFNWSTFYLSGGSIVDNGKGATTGVGVYLDYHGRLSMTGGEISGNQAASSSMNNRGGGIYVAQDATAILSGGTVSDNRATEGGGIYATGNVTISGTTLSDNYYEAIYVNGSTVEMTSGTLDNNAVRLYNGGFRMTGGSITDTPNAVQRAGTALYATTFEFGGTAKFDSNSYASVYVTLIDNGVQVFEDHALRLFPSNYLEGMQIVEGDPPGLVSTNYTKIDVAPHNGERWEVDVNGCLVNTHEPAEDWSDPDTPSSEESGDSGTELDSMTTIIAVIIVLIIIIAVAAVVMKRRSGNR